MSSEPAQIWDAGGEMSEAIFRFTAGDPLRVQLQGRKGWARAKVAQRWIEVEDTLTTTEVWAGRSEETMLLLPSGAEACRLRITYQTAMFRNRLWRNLPASIKQRLASFPAVRDWLWPAGIPTSWPSRWRQATVEVSLPPRGAVPGRSPRHSQTNGA